LKAAAHAVLPSRGPTKLVLRAHALEGDGQRLAIFVDGSEVFDQGVSAGMIDVRIPLAGSTAPRRVDLRWAEEMRLSATDPRLVAARLEYLGPAPASPMALHLPDDLLTTPGLERDGIDSDGWTGRRVHVVLRGGPAAQLVIRAHVPLVEDQRLTVLVNDAVVSDQAPESTKLDARIPVGPCTGERHVELRWSMTAPLGPRDPRSVAALLSCIGLASGQPPLVVESLADQLKDPELDYAGIDADGWIARTSTVTLGAGPAGTLVARLQEVAVAEQKLDVRVNGRPVSSQPVSAGPVTVRANVPSSDEHRIVELEWAHAAPLSSDDDRERAALLQFVGVLPPTQLPSRIRFPDDGAATRFASGGIHADGWSEREAWLELAGGPETDVVLRAHLAAPRSQRLEVRVNGEFIAVGVPIGTTLELRGRLPECPDVRHVDLRWQSAYPLAQGDSRQVAACLEEVGIEAPTGGFWRGRRRSPLVSGADQAQPAR
jgi:hypothetical protein